MLTADDLTADWLSEALDGTVTDVTWRPLGTGQMCDSVALTLTAEPGVPAHLVAKLPSADETSRATALMMRSYEKEVRFYQELAARLDVQTPAVHHAEVDPATGDFVLLLEDLSPAVPGDQLAGCDRAVAKQGVEQLVRLHAPLWGDAGLEELEWLRGDEAGSRELLAALLPSLWTGFLERYDTQLSPEVRAAGAQLFPRLDGWLARGAGPRTVTHGDFRLDNLLFGPGGVTVLDWQTCALGSGPGDVAYFLGASLAPEDRRTAEKELFACYVEGLAARGVTGEDLWTDYRMGSWSGLVMSVGAAMMVERTDRGDRMFLTMAERHAQHALDLEAAELLGS